MRQDAFADGGTGYRGVCDSTHGACGVTPAYAELRAGSFNQEIERTDLPKLGRSNAK